MTQNIRILMAIIGVVVLSSCATGPIVKKNDISTQYLAQLTLPKLNQDDIKQIKRTLDQVIIIAKKKGPSAVSLLVDDLFIKASDASLKGQSNLALVFFKYAHQLNPEDFYLHEKYAFELVKSGDLKNAEVELAALVKTDPTHQKWNLVLAGVYNAQEKSKQAKKIYISILRKDKSNENACVSLNNIYMEKKHFKSSLALLEKCRQAAVSSSDKLNYVFYKVKNHVQNNKKTQAIKLLREIVKRDPAFQEAWLTLGLLYEEDKNFKKALTVYAEAIKKGSDGYLILSRLTNIMIVEGKVKESIPYLSRLVDLEPDNLNSLVKLGIAYSDAKQLGAAKNIFKKILTQVPDSDKVLYYLGVLSVEMSDYHESLEYFSRIPESSSFFLDGHLQMANVLRALAEGNKANASVVNFEETLIGFLEYGKDNEQYQMQLSLKLISYLENNNKIDRAIGYFDKIKGSSLFTVEHEYYLASLYERVSDREKARQIMLEIISKDPKNAQAYNFYGYSLLEEGDEIAKAYQYISKAVELKPKDAYIRDSLGWYYFTIKKYDEALRELKLAYKLFKKEPTILQHLAQVYRELKKHDLARKFYAEALKSSTTEQSKKELLKQMREFGYELDQNKRIPASE